MVSDAHVVPANQDHDAAVSCWCQPMSEYEDAVTGGRVWLHRRAHDLPHRDPSVADPTDHSDHVEGDPS